jgi:hypothetical protein
MQSFKDFRPLLVGSLVRELRQGSSIISVGLPGTALMQALAGLRPDLRPMEILSEETLTARAAYADALLAEDRLAVARQAGDGLVGAPRRLGAHSLTGPLLPVRYRALPDVLAQIGRAGLLHFGPEPGHCGLLVAALPVLAGREMVVWLDLPAGGAPAALAELEAAGAGAEFALFAVSPERGISRPSEAGPATTGILAVPRGHWDSAGLEALADARSDGARIAAFRGGVLVPRAQRMSADLLARLAPGRRNPRIHMVAKKTFLPAVQRVFGDGVRITSDDHGTKLFQTTWQAEARLVFQPPTAGRYNLGVVMGNRPGADLLSRLTIAVDRSEVPMAWVADWWQFASRVPVVITESRLPVTITFRYQGMGETGGLDLLIKGIELQLVEQFSVDFQMLELQDGRHQGDALSVEGY